MIDPFTPIDNAGRRALATVGRGVSRAIEVRHYLPGAYSIFSGCLLGIAPALPNLLDRFGLVNWSGCVPSHPHGCEASNGNAVVVLYLLALALIVVAQANHRERQSPSRFVAELGVPVVLCILAWAIV